MSYQLLMLNYEFPPIGGGASPVTFDLCRQLVKLGHKVDVVTMHYGNLPRVEIVEGTRVFRTPAIRARPDICRTHELWLIAPKGFMGLKQDTFLPLNSSIIERYDEQWSEMLRKAFDEDEALRYELLKPFRDYVMNNYRIVSMFGQHVLFEIKEKQTSNQGDSM